MKCKCGKLISGHLHGMCLECRYKRLRAPKGIRLKIPADRLPKPPLTATKPVRIGEVVPDWQVMPMMAEYGFNKPMFGNQDMSPEMAKARACRGRKHASRKRNEWTPEKDAELVRLRHEGKSYSDIQSITGRSLRAIEHRLIKLRKEGKY